MFPLSVKNPNVPLQGSGKRGRRRRQQASEGGPPARDKTRLELGPERFVRWDIEPMGEVQKALDRLAVRAAEGGVETGESLRPVARQLNSLKSVRKRKEIINYPGKLSRENIQGKYPGEISRGTKEDYPGCIYNISTGGDVVNKYIMINI